MMSVSITAALLAFLFIALSFRIIRLRRTRRVAIGTGGDPIVERAMRVQANFAEYVPLTLVLLLLCAMRGLPESVVGLLGAVFVIGRSAHAYGVAREPEDFRFRVAGMMITFGTLAVSALSLLVLAFWRP